MNPLLVLALVFFQTIPVANQVKVGADFTAPVVVGTWLDELPDSPDEVLRVGFLDTVGIMAHNGLAGTEFHDFRRGESVWLTDAEGNTRKFILTRSMTDSARMRPYRLTVYDIVFITCADNSGERLLIWIGMETDN